MSAISRSAAWADVSEEDGTLVLRIGGELDLQSRATIEPLLLAAVANVGSVLVDLRALTFCDSRGVAILLAAQQRADATGTTLVVDAVQPAVRRMFELSRLDRVLHVTDSTL